MARLSTDIRVAGYSVRLSGSTPAALADLRSVICSEPPAVTSPDFGLEVAARGLRRPSRAADRRAEHVDYWEDGDTLVLATSPTQTARVEGNAALLDPGPYGARGLHILLMPVLGALLGPRGLCVAHGAAFVDGPGAAVVLGASGQGKSTLVAVALSMGCRVLSDDLVVLRLDADGPAVAGVPQPLALPHDLRHIAGVGDAIVGDHRRRHAPTPSVVLDGNWHAVRTVIIVEHSPLAAGHLLPATHSEAFHLVRASTLEGVSEGSAGRAFPFAAALARVPAWRLGHSRGAADRVAAAAGWIAATRAAHPQRG